MSTATQHREPVTHWEQEIRTLEEQGRVAFLAGDISTLDRLMDDRLLVNSPLNIVNDKAKVLDLLGKGLIRHTRDDVEIENIARYGDVVTVMGRDTVDGPPSNTLTHRRFTNIWQLQDGAWRMIARHAQVIAPR
ncbi:MAG: nuclear transport factor 2 family protein [Gemmatimonadales bacterium]